MKTVVLSLFAGLCITCLNIPTAWAIQPQDICGVVPCSVPMKAIADTFVATGPVDLTEGQAFSGVCYYLGGGTTADYPHAGLAVFTPNAAGKTEYRGVFSYYGKPADFASLTYEQAYKKLNSDRPKNILINGPLYSGYVNSRDDADFSYWFGMSADKKSVSLISVWTFGGQLGQVSVCDLKANTPAGE